MMGCEIEGIKIIIDDKANATIWREQKKDNCFISNKMCVFKWDDKKQVYRIVDETPEFWELKINESLFNLYINQLYEDLMQYHSKLDSLRHDKKIIEELYSTIKNEPKRGQK